MPIPDPPRNVPAAAPNAAPGAAPGAALDAAIHRFAPQLPLAVAFSGGADSTALLLACAERWPGQVVAIHVHHGLQS
ncbi:ATP-binding protein, partial [Delftia acidovorans]|uniref:ATP-binding protein n=1 Tax=Delftia acidovorans TaxID=80866 RepID=UPI0035A01C62